MAHTVPHSPQQNTYGPRFCGECGQKKNGPTDKISHFRIPPLDLQQQQIPSSHHRYLAQQPPQTILPKPNPTLPQLQQHRQQQLDRIMFLPPCPFTPPQLPQHQQNQRCGTYTAVEPGREINIGALPLSHQSQTIDDDQDKTIHQPHNVKEQKRTFPLRPRPKAVRSKSSARSNTKSILSGWKNQSHVQRACQFVWNVENHKSIESTSDARWMSFLKSGHFCKNTSHKRLNIETIKGHVRRCNDDRLYHWNNGEMWVRACYSGAKLRLDVANSRSTNRFEGSELNTISTDTQPHLLSPAHQDIIRGELDVQLSQFNGEALNRVEGSDFNTEADYATTSSVPRSSRHACI